MYASQKMQQTRWMHWIAGILMLVSGSMTIGAAHAGEARARIIADRSNPWLLLSDGRPISTAPAADRQPVGAEARSLARADLDHDGTPDVLVGLADGELGRIEVFLGDPSLYPARGTAMPFLPEPRVFVVPLPADWIAAGDFNGDGMQDVIAAARGDHRLALLPGNGAGELSGASLIDLPGTVTALVAGEVNRYDGLVDLVVGISNGAGSQLLVFESPQGALRAAPESFALPAPATTLAIGELYPGAEREIVAGAGTEVLVVSGRDRKLSWPERARSQVPEADCRHFGLGAPVTGVALGRFTGEKGRQLAVLTADQVVHLLQADSDTWQEERLDSSQSAGAGVLLASGRISALPQHDLVLDHGHGRLSVGNLAGVPATTAGEEGAQLDSRIEAEQPIVAVLPMRINLDALDDLVVLLQGHCEPLVLTSMPAATFTVNAVYDTDDGDCNVTHCSLREAIHDANWSAGLDTIEFTTGTGFVYINSAMDAIGGPLVIDGLQGVYPFTHKTKINGQYSPSGAAALPVGGDSVTITDLSIFGFDGAAISLDGDGCIVERCELGVYGVVVDGNGTGLLLTSSADNTIGGSSSLGNVIAGNTGPGIDITGGSASTNNIISGNYIGTNSSGNTSFGNGGAGILLEVSATANIIGSIAAPNVIAGNTGCGVQLGGVGTYAPANTVINNFIGVTGDGSTALANGCGIWIGDRDTTIGGTTGSLGNVISGNLGHGIEIDGGAWDVVVQGNIIGLAADASTVRSNGGSGVVIDSADMNLIGSTVNRPDNIISANGGWGIEITGSAGNAPMLNEVMANFVGTDGADTGTSCRGNSAGGIYLSGHGNAIGSSEHGTGNLIGCNGGAGIEIEGTSALPAAANVVLNNHIGGWSSNGNLPNQGNGLTITGVVSDTVVGQPSAGNHIDSSGGAGIVVSGNPVIGYPSGTSIRCNFIDNNGGLGIDLASTSSGDGVTANDASPDSDIGPNKLQNYPVILGIYVIAGDTLITVSLESKPNTSYTIDVYWPVTACDASGHGEARAYLGSTQLTTNGDGIGVGSLLLEGMDLGETFVSTTATDPDGNTSELSECFLGGHGLVTRAIFADNFENGDTLRWSQVVQ